MNLTGFYSLLSEGLVIALMFAVFAADLFFPSIRKRLGALTAWGLAAILGCLLWQGLFAAGPKPGAAFQGTFLADPMALFFKALFILTAAVVVLLTREFLKKYGKNPGEFYLLILSALLGMLFLASANDFILLFVSVELVTVSFYVMTAYLKTDQRSVEAGIKYLILGALSSGMMLYGISFIYGHTGSTHYDAVRAALSGMPSAPPLLLLGILLLIAGLGFKAGAVPFQLWIPDVYEGAPIPVTAFLSVGSKMAGFAALLRICVSVIAPFEKTWALLMAVIAAMTLVYGNLGAIPQKNIKRFFGYSGIGHAGYLLTAIAAGGFSGARGVLFYLLSYAVTMLAAFLVVVFCSVHLESDDMSAYDGLSRRSPLLAGALFLSLLSLAGVPPLSGFFAKFLVLSSAVEKDLIWLAVLGALNVVISLYYYLTLVKRMYIYPPAGGVISVPLSFQIPLYLLMLGIVGIGVVQGPFVRLAASAVSGFF